MLRKGQHNCLDDEFKLIVKNAYFSSLSEQKPEASLNKIKVGNALIETSYCTHCIEIGLI